VRSNGDGRPVVSLDIDGTLADYHGWFLQFAELYLGRPMPAPDQINPGRPLYQHMGVSRAIYREVKLAYRQGGMKRSMPCLEGAADLVRWVRRRAEVWICTTRPFLRLDNIDPDTREWLRRNGIKYDALLFDPTDTDWKYRELKRQAGARVCAVAEDLPEQAMRAWRLGLGPVFLRNQPYNRHFGSGAKAYSGTGQVILDRWSKAEQLQELLEKAINDWEG
jgi:hypothetical protein